MSFPSDIRTRPRQVVYGKRHRAVVYAALPSPRSSTGASSPEVADKCQDRTPRQRIQHQGHVSISNDQNSNASEIGKTVKGRRKKTGAKASRSDDFEILAVAEELDRMVVYDRPDVGNKLESRPAVEESNGNSRRPPGKARYQRERPRREATLIQDEGVQETGQSDAISNDREIPASDAQVQLPRSKNVVAEQVREGQSSSHIDSSKIESEPFAGSTSSPSPATSNIYKEHCETLLSFSNHPLIDFTKWAEQLTEHLSICKLAEASFGEVYQLSLLELLPDFDPSDESVIKIIALTPPDDLLPTDKRKRAAAKKKNKGLSSPADVATEVRLLQRMTAIPGFTNFRDVRIVQGRPPLAFAHAFHAYEAVQKARGKESSVFPDPCGEDSYPADQLWAVVEMQHAGTDLERCVEAGECSSIWSVWDVFWQATLALAKGEEGAEFEHRDLHLGNVCVRRLGAQSARMTSASKKTQSIQPTIDHTRKLNFTGIDTTLIDYTISRAQMTDGTSVAHVDLARDPSLFTADSAEEYQYEIYRYMCGAAMLDDAHADFSRPHVVRRAKASGRSWRDFRPRSNLLWLHFILFRLLEQLAWPSETTGRKKGKQALSGTLRKRALELEAILLQVQEALDPRAICRSDGLSGASELVGWALSEGWLDVGDVVGDKVDDSTHLENFLPADRA